MITSTSAFTAPHQDTNGLGAVLHCVSVWKAFLLPFNAGIPIGNFEDVKVEFDVG